MEKLITFFTLCIICFCKQLFTTSYKEKYEYAIVNLTPPKRIFIDYGNTHGEYFKDIMRSKSTDSIVLSML
jgi:hypothetical protein